MKTCTRCHRELATSDFYTSGKYLRAECKNCTGLMQAAGRFGISVERLSQMYADQGSACAICGEPCTTYKSLSIDHDHTCCPTPGKSCGKCVRGLLCNACNHGLGCFNDNPSLLAKAIEYIA